MKYLKRTFNLLMAVVIVFNIAVNDYIVANATGEEIIIPTLSVLDSVLTTFGISIGVGVQKSHEDLLNDTMNILEGAANGSTVKISGYGDVDFSNDQSIKNFIDWAYLYNDYSLGALSPTDVGYSNAVDLLAYALDDASYKNTGSCATNSMNAYISDLRERANTAGISDEIAEACKIAIGKVPVDKIENWWSDVCGFMSCIALGTADAFNDWVNGFETSETTEFTDYSIISSDLGAYSPSAAKKYYNGQVVIGIGFCYGLKQIYLTSFDYVFGLREETSDITRFYRCDGFTDLFKYSSTSVTLINGERSSLAIGTIPDEYGGTFLYIPVFSSLSDAKNYYNYGNTSGILNLVSDYADFKTYTPGVDDTIGRALSNVKVGELPTVIDAVDDVVVGLPGTIPDTVEVVDTIVADPSIPVPDNPAIDDPVVVDPDKPVEDEDENPKPAPAPAPIPDSSTSPGFIGGILALLSILLMLLKIFLHLLEFIVNIFKIPADPGFITGDFKLGFEYIKTVKLSPLNMSIYDFLMGLVHITIFFGVVKILRQKIDKIHF